MQQMANTSGFVTVEGLEVYYEVHGALGTQVTPLVLLHGGAMAIETGFGDDLLPRFAGSRTVIAIEQQGHGHTGDRPGPASIERMVEDTSAVLRALGSEPADLLGHSLGGIIALGMGVRHPDQVRSLTTLGTFSELDGMLPELARMQRGQQDEPSAELVPLLPTEQDFARWRAHFERHAPDPTRFDAVMQKLNMMLGQWRGWSAADLHAIAAPTLVAIGDNDFVRVEHAAEMARLIPHAQLAVLPGTTHMNIVARGAWLQPMMEAMQQSAQMNGG